MNHISRRFRDIFLIGGLLFLIFGIRIFIGIRFVALIPQMDDWGTLPWLQNWSDGVRDWGFIFQRTNNHPLVLYYLMDLGQYLLNGYWDARLDFLASAFMHTAYATVVILTFRNVLTPQDQRWLLALIFFLFAIPFAGYRINWGMIWPHSTMMLFSLWALYVAAYHHKSWAGIFFIFLLASLAALNMAAGCLAALTVAGLTLFRAAVARRITIREVTLSIGCLVLFLCFYLTMRPEKSVSGFLEAANALLKALAWPVVFTPIAGIFTLIPLVGLVLAYIYSPSFHTRNLEFLLGIGGLIFLISVATGMMRGDNNNMGMPSGRYTEIYVMVPLFCATALCALFRGSVGLPRLGWGIFAWIWLCLQVFGFSIHLLYRTLPFMAHENGEWSEPNKQILLRDTSRGVGRLIVPASDPLWDSTVDLALSTEMMQGKAPLPAVTLPMIVGFPVLEGSQGNYKAGGYHPDYQPRPAQLYMGSFDADNRSVTNKWFLSAPFKTQAPYLTIDVLVDKKARFTNYRLDGLTLTLVNDTTGQRDELLPKLAHTFPFVLRDWELIYVRVTPGDEYRIESHDTNANTNQWIAFGEPFESGKLTPLIIWLTQSGKLICLCGIGLLVLAFGLEKSNVLSAHPARPRYGEGATAKER